MLRTVLVLQLSIFLTHTREGSTATYLHRNGYNHNGEDQSTKCPVSKHLRKQQGKKSRKSINGKIHFSQISYTNETKPWTKACDFTNYEELRRMQHRMLQKNLAYDRSKINNPRHLPSWFKTDHHKAYMNDEEKPKQLHEMVG